MLYRALKDGEEIDLGTGSLENGIFVPFCINHVSIGKKYDPKSFYHTLVVQVDPPTLEEVKTTISEICDSRDVEGCKNITCEECSYKAILKLMEFTGGE